MVSQIIARLGLDTTAFRSGVQRAERSMQRLQRAGSQLGLGSALGVAAIGMAFRSVINNARNAEGELDKNTAAVQRYAEQLDDLRGGAMRFGTAIIGSLNRAGEAGGLWIRGLVRGREEKEALIRETERQVKLEAELAEVSRRRQEMMERAMKLEKDREAITGRIAEAQFRELSPLEQVIVLRNKLFELQSKSLDGMDRAQRMEIENQILQLKGIDLAQAEKRLADESEKQREKEAQQVASINQHIQRSLDSRAKFLESQLSTTERLNNANDRLRRLVDQIHDINRETIEGAKEYADTLADIVGLEQDIADLKSRQADEQERLNNAIKSQQDAAKNLQEAEDKLANAARERAQFTMQEAARGEAGPAEQRRAQRIEREVQRQRDLARRFERAQERGAPRETLEDLQRQVQESMEREARDRREMGPGLRPEDRDPFAAQREAVENAKKQLEKLTQIAEELKQLGKEPQP